MTMRIVRAQASAARLGKPSTRAASDSSAPVRSTPEASWHPAASLGYTAALGVPGGYVLHSTATHARSTPAAADSCADGFTYAARDRGAARPDARGLVSLPGGFGSENCARWCGRRVSRDELRQSHRREPRGALDGR